MDFSKSTSSAAKCTHDPVLSTAGFLVEPMKIIPVSKLKPSEQLQGVANCPDFDAFPPGLGPNDYTPAVRVAFGGIATHTSWNVNAKVFVPNTEIAQQPKEGYDTVAASCELQSTDPHALEILPGTVVRLQGLIDDTLNGVRSVVDRWDVEKEQWVVTLQDGSERLANADNLLAFVSESYRMPLPDGSASPWLYSVVWVKPEEYWQWEFENFDARNGYNVETLPQAQEVHHDLPPVRTKSNISIASGSTVIGRSSPSSSESGKESDDTHANFDAFNLTFYKTDDGFATSSTGKICPGRFEKFLGKGRDVKRRSRSLTRS